MIPCGTTIVVLHGLLSQLKERDKIQVYHLAFENSKICRSEEANPNTTVPAEIKQLLDQYSNIFASKVSFPPIRASSHSILLLPGATPIHIRPYRYTSTLKNEIERHLQEMLQAGLIQHSSKPFSSPMLLVKKKDNTYRFCVDYKYLNDITKKG
jgi:hypothetical protein